MMESWNHIINTAILGTDKARLKKEALYLEDLPVDQLLAGDNSGAEGFLQVAAAVFNFRQCGFVPLKQETVSISKAEAEVKPYASTKAHQVLNDLLEAESTELLHFWLEQ